MVAFTLLTFQSNQNYDHLYIADMNIQDLKEIYVKMLRVDIYQN